MLQITVPSVEGWDESKQEFVNLKEQTLRLEHSLVSLSKWESKWCKSFFSKKRVNLEKSPFCLKLITINPYPFVLNCFLRDAFNAALRDIISARLLFLGG